MADKFTYDPSTSLGRVRLLIGDRNEQEWIFSDDEINSFLDLEEDDILWAAAQALDTIANNDAMIHKRIRLLNLSNDGVSIAGELRARAQELRRQKPAFDIADLPDLASDDYV